MKTTKKSTAVKSESKPASKKAISHEAIAERAYHIYLETGSTDEHANWVKAEKELKSSK